ncbi:MAG TPA: lysophospholipid acyltransferase family protein [Gemmatimonadales bacterium]|jgi:1-acyl-sn-glycerol-3-phosphate acyltransferase
MKRAAGFVVRVFFRRTAVSGSEQVPRDGPVILVLNHPNALIDPLFVLAFAPRPVSFLAKEPLFHMPIVGRLVRRAGSIPVYRRQDAADMSQNRATFDQVRAALLAGRAIALFPEGTSHSDARLRPFKTGAARMALDAAAAGNAPVTIVPAGLYYTAKARFRSSALLRFGAPIRVDATITDSSGEPDATAVRELTATLEAALALVTLQADHDAALQLVTRAERIYSSGDPAPRPSHDLADQFALRQRFVRGYARLRIDAPAELDQLERRLERFDGALARVRLAPESIASSSSIPAGDVLRRGTVIVALFPIAMIGMVIHWPAYRIIGPLLTRGMKVETDALGTAKILVAALLFPLSWIVAGVLVGWRGGWIAGVVAGLVAPACGYAALRFLELLDRSVGILRGIVLRSVRPRTFRRLEAERRKIRETIVALGERAER